MWWNKTLTIYRPKDDHWEREVVKNCYYSQNKTSQWKSKDVSHENRVFARIPHNIDIYPDCVVFLGIIKGEYDRDMKSKYNGFTVETVKDNHVGWLDHIYVSGN